MDAGSWRVHVMPHNCRMVARAVRGRNVRIAAGALGLLALTILALAVTGTKPLDFEARGLLLPGHGEVWRIRIAGLVTIHVPEFHVGVSDVLVSMLLVATGTAAGVTWAVLRDLGGSRTGPLLPFHAVVAIGGIGLAIDETFGVHETIGYAIELAFGAPPFFHKPDDAVFAAYVVIALAVAWRFRRIALEPGVARRVVVAGLAFVILLTIADVLNFPGEESFEVLLAAYSLGAYLLLARNHVTRFSGAQP
jgi:hypothetical protein